MHKLEIKSSKNVFKAFALLMNSARAYVKYLVIAITGLLLTRLSEAAIYKFLIPQTVNYGLIDKDLHFMRQMPWMILIIFLCLGIGEFLSKFMMGLVGRGVVRDYRVSMLNHLLEVPVAYYKNNSSGILLSKINYDAEQVAIAVSDAIREFLSSIIAISVLISAMVSISWQVTVGCILIIPLVAGYLHVAGKFMRKYSARVQHTMGNLTHVASEVINSYPVIKIYGGKLYEQKRIREAANNNFKQELKMFFVKAISSPIMQLIAGSTLVFFVSIVGFNILPLTTGEIFGLIGIMFAMIRPLKQITEVNNVFQKGLTAVASIHNLLYIPKEKESGSMLVNCVQGRVVFDKVNFCYYPKHDNAKALALSNISFSVAAGKTVAIIGRSGSGKSTLISLLVRFFEPSSGRILLDGIDIKQYSLTNLRSQFAMVAQQTMLFNDTVANNIAYGCNNKVSQKDIKNAAQAAYALEFIESLPNGFDTYIGENGSLLSGGQRQRLAIARAILKNAPILILDEATSALDTESERHIQLAMEYLMANKTTFIISHRLSTIKNADTIIVLDKGCVVDQGNYEVLSNKKAWYATMGSW